ncbi:TraM recognition domain-containing protein (plasmid) [Iamia sp. SCSIO 61187]|uniref:type IV secretory system conjugative DNA transfer family protein n=1 Tax=Iamia sp. SCSIO 61187 TaxID=2722752 RepID=UPI001C636FB8|nr:TraM recognition domain-containing protein [Iamia sp. SCSIO 61187]QYG95855.1 TraM recognition domain-containing protein [Iamia sp. SCSIO 61187]
MGLQPTGARATSPLTLETVLLGLIATAGLVIGSGLVGVHLTVLATEGHLARAPWTDLAGGLAAIPSNAGDPAAAFPAGTGIPGPVAFWALFVAAVGVELAAAGALVGMVTRAARRRRLSLPGRSDLAPLGAKALEKRAGRLRPGLNGRHAAGSVGIRLGRAIEARGAEVWASAEDTIVVYGPPRSGKTMYVVIPAVLAWPGPALVTGTRPDVLVHTLRQRAAAGPTAVFDPLGAWTGDPAWRLRWSPVVGCEAPDLAWRRARVFVAAAGTGKGVENATYWTTAASSVLRSLLHAAALAGATTARVRLWAADPLDDEPVHILRSDGPSGWAAELHAMATADPRTVSNVYAGVRQAIDVLGLPQVAELCEVDRAASWDPDQLLDGLGAVYMLGTPSEQDMVAPLVAALADAVVHAAERRAAAAPGGRLDPPLLLALDEVANIAPLPGLPQLLATGGGSGLATMAVLQSPSQARARWGRDGASTMRDAARIRMVLGGLAAGDDLEELSRSWGERDDPIRSSSIDAKGHHSVSDATRRMRVAPVEKLRSLPPGVAMVAAGAHPPTEVRMTPWWELPAAAAVEADKTWAEAGARP